MLIAWNIVFPTSHDSSLVIPIQGSPNFVRIVYLPTTPAEELLADVFVSYFDSQGLAIIPVNDENITGAISSDSATFQEYGIPSTGLWTGINDQPSQLKTVEQAAIFGGTAGEYFDPCWTKECDDINNVNAQVLDEMSDAIAHALLTLADMKDLGEYLNVTDAEGGGRRLIADSDKRGKHFVK